MLVSFYNIRSMSNSSLDHGSKGSILSAASTLEQSWQCTKRVAPQRDKCVYVCGVSKSPHQPSAFDRYILHTYAESAASRLGSRCQIPALPTCIPVINTRSPQRQASHLHGPRLLWPAQGLKDASFDASAPLACLY